MSEYDNDNNREIPYDKIPSPMFGPKTWVVVNDDGVEQMCPECGLGLIWSNGKAEWCSWCEKAWAVIEDDN